MNTNWGSADVVATSQKLTKVQQLSIGICSMGLFGRGKTYYTLNSYLTIRSENLMHGKMAIVPPV